jgi:hypothetical protein
LPSSFTRFFRVARFCSARSAAGLGRRDIVGVGGGVVGGARFVICCRSQESVIESVKSGSFVRRCWEWKWLQRRAGKLTLFVPKPSQCSPLTLLAWRD